MPTVFRNFTSEASQSFITSALHSVPSSHIPFQLVLPVLAGAFLGVYLSGVTNVVPVSSLVDRGVPRTPWCHLSLLYPLVSLQSIVIHALAATRHLATEALCVLVLFVCDLASVLLNQEDAIATWSALALHCGDLVVRDAAATVRLIAEALSDAVLGAPPDASASGAELPNAVTPKPNVIEDLFRPIDTRGIVFKASPSVPSRRLTSSTRTDHAAQLRHMSRAAFKCAVSHLDDPYEGSFNVRYPEKDFDSAYLSDAQTSSTSDDEETVLVSGISHAVQSAPWAKPSPASATKQASVRSALPVPEKPALQAPAQSPALAGAPPAAVSSSGLADYSIPPSNKQKFNGPSASSFALSCPIKNASKDKPPVPPPSMDTMFVDDTWDSSGWFHGFFSCKGYLSSGTEITPAVEMDVDIVESDGKLELGEDIDPDTFMKSPCSHLFCRSCPGSLNQSLSEAEFYGFYGSWLASQHVEPEAAAYLASHLLRPPEQHTNTPGSASTFCEKSSSSAIDAPSSNANAVATPPSPLDPCLIPLPESPIALSPLLPSVLSLRPEPSPTPTPSLVPQCSNTQDHAPTGSVGSDATSESSDTALSPASPSLQLAASIPLPPSPVLSKSSVLESSKETKPARSTSPQAQGSIVAMALLSLAPEYDMEDVCTSSSSTPTRAPAVELASATAPETLSFVIPPITSVSQGALAPDEPNMGSLDVTSFGPYDVEMETQEEVWPRDGLLSVPPLAETKAPVLLSSVAPSVNNPVYGASNESMDVLTTPEVGTMGGSGTPENTPTVDVDDVSMDRCRSPLGVSISSGSVDLLRERRSPPGASISSGSVDLLRERRSPQEPPDSSVILSGEGSSVIPLSTMTSLRTRTMVTVVPSLQGSVAGDPASLHIAEAPPPSATELAAQEDSETETEMSEADHIPFPITPRREAARDTMDNPDLFVGLPTYTGRRPSVVMVDGIEMPLLAGRRVPRKSLSIAGSYCLHRRMGEVKGRMRLAVKAARSQKVTSYESHCCIGDKVHDLAHLYTVSCLLITTTTTCSAPMLLNICCRLSSRESLSSDQRITESISECDPPPAILRESMSMSMTVDGAQHIVVDTKG
ncbi:uncharacterized protein BXZ73DRAFT_75909 [Epithele typhae]|uniref:uncharacterized protein n=1 Tax=Epithele typhae TaxID=378194 RepID=UPI0020072089|nr:uncharacterized protein BXZ73DRAFT_75909 [Epithele typhae]KAH9939735.1 hypothetical protein BXZ73DRAFT_75909 [Epithele typhae]